jgi:hypothetical protein
VVFKGKKPHIYFSWHECAQQVVKVEGAIFQKYSNYDDAVRAFTGWVNAPPLLLPSVGSPGEVTTSHMLLTDDGCETKPHAAGNHGSWKNVVILILLMLMFGLWCRLSMCKNC